MTYNSQQFFLQKRKIGLITPVLCTMRILGTEDMEEAVQFHKRISDGIGDAGFFSEENTLEASIKGEGVVAGAFGEGKLVALRAVSYVKEYVRDAMEDLGLDPSEVNSTAVMDFCVTDPAYRGNNLQFFTYIFIENVLYPNRYHLHTTVSPKNIYSIANVLKCGFYAVGFKEKYGGHSRFVFYKNMRKPTAILTRAHKEILLRNHDYHPKVLADGYMGYRVRHKARGTVMYYGRPFIADNEREGS